VLTVKLKRLPAAFAGPAIVTPPPSRKQAQTCGRL